jgi:hypothetical protein
LSRHNAVDTTSTHTIYRNLAHEQIILFGVLRPDGSSQRVVFGFSVRRMNVPTPRALATIAFGPVLRVRLPQRLSYRGVHVARSA